MRSIFIAALVALLFVPVAMQAQTVTVVSAIQSTPPYVSDVENFLVGPDATDLWEGQTDKIAVPDGLGGWDFLNGSSWDEVRVSEPPMLLVNLKDSQDVVGVFFGSKWTRLTPERAKWRPGTKLNSFTLSPGDHNRWFWISVDGDGVATLPRPFDERQFNGMEWVAEVLTLEGNTFTFTIPNEGSFRFSDGTMTEEIVVPENSYRLLRFTAGQTGTSSTENHWYVWQ